MRKYTVILTFALILTLALSACTGNTADTATTTEATEVETTIDRQNMNKIANYGSTLLEITGVEFLTSENGDHMVRVNALFANMAPQPRNVQDAFVVKVVQNGEIMQDLSDINGTESSQATESRNAQDVEVSYLFRMDDLSQIKLVVCVASEKQEVLLTHRYTPAN